MGLNMPKTCCVSRISRPWWCWRGCWSRSCCCCNTGRRPRRPCSTPTMPCGSRRCAPGSPASGWYRSARGATAAAERLRHALVEADRCRSRWAHSGVPAYVDHRVGRALDARFVATALAAADHVGMVAIAWRIAGREAAMVALLLALVGVPAYQQFTPGRIDHHNVQIALTLLVVAAIVWSDRKRWTAAAAGALSGLGSGDRLRMPAVSRGVRRRAGGALCAQPRRGAGAARLRSGAGRQHSRSASHQRRSRSLDAHRLRLHRHQMRGRRSARGLVLALAG